MGGTGKAGNDAGAVCSGVLSALGLLIPYLSIMNKSFFTILLMASPLIGLSQNDEHYLLVGTYTSPKSEGIYVYQFNSTTGNVSPVSKVGAGNPSYLAVSPDQSFVFAVNEDGNDKGSVGAYAFNKENGTLTLINKQPSGGDHPCYVSVDQTGKWVAVGNYTGGNLSMFPVMVNGSLGNPQTTQHMGSSVVKSRQEKAHVHATVFSPDNQYLFVPDLGMDKVMVYAFNAGSGKLDPQEPVSTTPGAGPRHLAFHPNGKFAYLAEELTADVSAYTYNNGKLTFIQRISALPAGFNGSKSGADLHVSPDGRFLYVSNRGTSNSIAIFSIDKRSGKLALVGHQATLGETPRNFNFDPSGNFLLVANQDSDNIVIFKRNTKTGLLEDTGKRIEVGKPVCIKWITIEKKN
jgi:6-phosphogluconolactonase